MMQKLVRARHLCIPYVSMMGEASRAGTVKLGEQGTPYAKVRERNPQEGAGALV
jgi:hypothetical protein